MKAVSQALRPGHGGFLEVLTPAARAALVRRAVRVRYPAGKWLLRAGDPGEHVVVIETGWVRVQADTPHGNETTLAIRGPGDVVGEMSVVAGVPRSANVEAMESVAALRITAADFLGVLERTPSASMAMMRVLAARLRDADRHRAGLGGARSDRRVELALVELAVQYRHELVDAKPVRLSVSREELANFTGLSTSSVARALSRLRSAGILGPPANKMSISIVRPDRLRSRAAGLDLGVDR